MMINIFLGLEKIFDVELSYWKNVLVKRTKNCSDIFRKISSSTLYKIGSLNDFKANEIHDFGNLTYIMLIKIFAD